MPRFPRHPCTTKQQTTTHAIFKKGNCRVAHRSLAMEHQQYPTAKTTTFLNAETGQG
eukprot:m.32767 g.32767  ORF g.32767 m.32767 type:complete len:57 (+) comp10147_c0_seq1:1-171(+)